MRAPCAAAVLLLAACQPAPFGEVLLSVGTDVAVPRLVSSLQVDLYRADGSWYESRRFPLARPEDWPASFGVVTTDSAGGHVRVRLRAFRDGALRDYHGERFQPPMPFVPPPVATSIDDLCASAPTLPLGAELTARRGASQVTLPTVQGDCTLIGGAGAIAAKVVVPTAGDYRFEVVNAVPDAAHGDVGGDTTLYLRSDCRTRASQLGCNDDIDAAHGNYLSRLDLTLKPGTYWLLTGGKIASPADLTVRFSRVGDPPPATPPPAPRPSEEPRLVVDGVDRTPTDEPDPFSAIDQLIELDVPFGERTTQTVTLGGNCFGVQADLASGTSCAADGSWSDATLDCPSAAIGDQVCVPGGAFVMGSRDVLGDVVGQFGPAPVPERVVTVAPFFLDRHEVTVGDWQRAVADGFASPDGTPLRNDKTLTTGNACTFSNIVDGREPLPVNCVSWYAARAFCQFGGGDLPTSVQWERAARGDGRRYPWGNDTPDCQRALYGADPRSQGECTSHPGPAAIDAMPWSARDTTELGISQLGGNVAEWVTDAARRYDDNCWRQSIAGCNDPDAPLRTVRGGYWRGNINDLLSAAWGFFAPRSSTFDIGFRCARSP